MSMQIDWVIERQHQDGSWDTVDCNDYSDFEYQKAIGDGCVDAFSEKNLMRLKFCRKDYTWFAILNGHNAKPDRTKFLSRSYLPEDMGEYAAASDRLGDWNPPGCYYLKDLRQAAEDDPRGICLSSKDKERVTQQYHHLIDILGAMTTPLVGPRAERLCSFPNMRDLSNHAQMQRMMRADGWRPIGDDTVRVLFGFVKI